MVDTEWIINSISDPIVVLTRDFRYEYVNDAALKMLNRTKKEMIGARIQDLYPESQNEPVFEQMKYSMASGVPIRYEHYSKVMHKWIRTFMYPSDKGMVLYFSDITSYKNFERRMQQQARMIDLTQDAVMVLDETNKILFWNNGAVKLYGWTTEEAIGKKAYELLETQFPEKIEAILSQMKKNGRWSGELIHKTKDNLQVTVDSNWEIFNLESGFQYLEINRDITERKRLEDKKDEFMSIAAHELKTPLTTVKAYSQLMEKLLHQKDSHEKLEILQHKQLNSIDKLNKLITELLDVTKIKAGKLELDPRKIHLETLVANTIDNIQAVTNSHVIKKTGDGDVWITADENRIEQVLTNLLTNAIKYSPNATDVEVMIQANEKEAVVGVLDHGVGIPKSEQKKLFDRYYRIRNSTNAPGLGLGLYLSNEIVIRHGGKMWVDSVKNKGSVFYFSLPY